MFHLLGYTGTGNDTTGVSPLDLSAITDPIFSQRNNHFIFTQQYQILAAYAMGNNISGATILCPTLNAITKFRLDGLNQSSVVLSPPRLDWWTEYPVQVPTNEEVQVQYYGTGTDTATVMLFLASADWNSNVPRGMPPVPYFQARITCTPTLAGKAWCPLAQIAFEQSLRGGTYSVVGAQLQGAGLIAYRFVFPRQKPYGGVVMRPGSLAKQAAGDQPIPAAQVNPLMWGEWGRFSTFELPQIECIGNGSTTVPIQGTLWLSRISEDMDVRY